MAASYLLGVWLRCGIEANGRSARVGRYIARISENRLKAVGRPRRRTASTCVAVATSFLLNPRMYVQPLAEYLSNSLAGRPQTDANRRFVVGRASETMERPEASDEVITLAASGQSFVTRPPAAAGKKYDVLAS